MSVRDRDRADHLRRALRDALDGMEEMLAYVPDRVGRKLDGYAERARAALDADTKRRTPDRKARIYFGARST